ncbi:hypothetical protein NMY22_g12514 [Coprinellus aureogranulatus]|nr:hypothetical protein NMY22_g12514 [Coprinellus aureogranulatus]
MSRTDGESPATLRKADPVERLSSVAGTVVDDAAQSPPFPVLEKIGSSSPKASEQVMLSQDLLPPIFSSLRELSCTNDQPWKAALLSLLVVNKACFHAGANILWNTMDSFSPVLRLLPWFDTEYKGIGMHDYSPEVDWKRFTFYASRIQSFKLQESVGITMSSAHFMELFTLPERPDPLFPILGSIAIGPEALMFLQSPLLFLLTAPSLSSIDIKACHQLSNYEAVSWTSVPSEHLLAVLPRLAASARQLRSFSYVGPTDGNLFNRLSKFTSLQTVRLHINGNEDFSSLQKLREKMHFLKNITIIAPALSWVDEFRAISIFAFSVGFPLESQSLHIVAKPYHHCLLARLLSPRLLRRIHLGVIKATEIMPFHFMLELYLKSNYDLNSVEVEFVWHSMQQPEIFQRLTSNDWPTESAASTRCQSALQNLKFLRKLDILDIPLSLAVSTCPLLRSGLVCWRSMTTLRFRVHLDSSSGSLAYTFPGLSFLASPIWNHCRALEEFEYHFDATLLADEDLMEALNSYDTPSTSASYQKSYHPLRTLRINTGKTSAESSSLDLSLVRKIQIAEYLDRLFPMLQSIEGSSTQIWSEVHTLVKSFQGIRLRFVREVGDMIDGVND